MEAGLTITLLSLLTLLTHHPPRSSPSSPSSPSSLITLLTLLTHHPPHSSPQLASAQRLDVSHLCANPPLSLIITLILTPTLSPIGRPKHIEANEMRTIKEPVAALYRPFIVCCTGNNNCLLYDPQYQNCQRTGMLHGWSG